MKFIKRIIFKIKFKSYLRNSIKRFRIVIKEYTDEDIKTFVCIIGRREARVRALCELYKDDPSIAKLSVLRVGLYNELLKRCGITEGMYNA